MALPVNDISNTNVASNKKNNYLFPFILVTSLFFFWGFVHNLDPILIPHLRKAFVLTDLQSSLVDTSVFIAYFVMALPAGYIMRRYGYKTGIILGLILFGIGSILFVPAANTLQYVFFLGALFIIACGLTFLETAANPYITVLGPEATKTQRLNFAQSFNGLAAFIAPAYIGKIILSGKELTEQQIAAMSTEQLHVYLSGEAASVKIPYLILGIIILLVAIIFYFTKLPDIKHEESYKGQSGFASALKSKRLKWGIATQFFYVGAQVCVGSFFIKMCTTAAGINEKTAAVYWHLRPCLYAGQVCRHIFNEIHCPGKITGFVCSYLHRINASGNLCLRKLNNLYINSHCIFYEYYVSHYFFNEHRGLGTQYQNWVFLNHNVHCGWCSIAASIGFYFRYN